MTIPPGTKRLVSAHEGESEIYEGAQWIVQWTICSEGLIRLRYSLQEGLESDNTMAKVQNSWGV